MIRIALRLSDTPGKRALKFGALFVSIMLVGGPFASALMLGSRDPHIPTALVVASAGWLVFLVLVLWVTRTPTLILDDDNVCLFRGRRQVARSPFASTSLELEMFRDDEGGDIPVVVIRFCYGSSVSIGSWGATTTGWLSSRTRVFAPRYMLERNEFYSLTEALGVFTGPSSEREASFRR